MKKLVPPLNSIWLSVAILFIYAIVGLFVVSDFGIGTDEVYQLQRSRAAYHYIFRDLLHSSDSPNVQNFVTRTPVLTSNPDSPYHGTALQMPLVAIEHMRDFTMTYDQIFLMRHVYNFLNYVLAAFFFFLILRKRFPSSPTPLFGLLMFILYPRFFGEAFYNIKDLMFFSWYVIAAYFSLRYIETPTVPRMLFFAGAAALATNLRIVGISLVLFTMTYIVITCIFKNKDNLKRAAAQTFIKSGLLLLGFFGFYVLVTPFMWESPISTFISALSHFSDYSLWDFSFPFMGQLITRNVPWYYIPVWIAISVPVLYSLLFAVGNLNAGCIVCKSVFRDRKISIEALYDSFFMGLFYLSFFGFVIFNISMYDAWRHVYFMFAPFLYLAVLDLNFIYTRCVRLSARLSVNKRIPITAFCILFFGYMSTLGFWIVRNHPYQYVYFNEFARGDRIEHNFQLDYWSVSQVDILRELLGRNDNFLIPVEHSIWSPLILRPEERERLVFVPFGFAPEYVVRGSSGHWRSPGQGFELIYSITVDGMEISSLHRYIIETAHFDCGAPDLISEISSNHPELVKYLFDGNMDTIWRTAIPRREGDYVQIEFSRPVQYNVIRVDADRLSSEGRRRFSSSLQIALSMDGITWNYPEVVFSNLVDRVLVPVEYKFIRLENTQTHDTYAWNIAEIKFGDIDLTLFTN